MNYYCCFNFVKKIQNTIKYLYGINQSHSFILIKSVKNSFSIDTRTHIFKCSYLWVVPFHIFLISIIPFLQLCLIYQLSLKCNVRISKADTVWLQLLYYITIIIYALLYILILIVASMIHKLLRNVDIRLSIWSKVIYNFCYKSSIYINSHW